MSQPQIGLLVPLEAKPGQSTGLRDFLLTGYTLLSGDQEPGTLQWFAVKYEVPNDAPAVYAVFDTFARESGRQAHATGEVAKALGANADTLLARAPDMPGGMFNVIASKVRPVGAQDLQKGLTCGLRVLIKAKDSQVQAVRDFLKGALPLVEAEEQTAVWYAIEFPGTNVFGIVDFFPGQGGLDAHMKGKVAEALFANVDTLLQGAPDVIKFEVLATKI